MSLDTNRGLRVGDFGAVKSAVDEILRALSGQIDSTNLKIDEVSTAIARSIQDGDLAPLNNFMNGQTPAGKIAIRDYIEFCNVDTDPSPPTPGKAKLYLFDNGTELELRVRLNTGSPINLLTGGAGNITPVASIDSITPNPADTGITVSFNGSGTDADGTIVAYEWTSDVDGGIGGGQDAFTTSNLSVGAHVISFRVQDDSGAWSPPVTSNVTINAVNTAPTATIDSITPTPSLDGDNVNFLGSASDADGTIVGYLWSSDRDGQLATTEDFSTSNLSVGTHVISFRAQDNSGAWSSTVTQSITVQPITSGIPEPEVPWEAGKPTVKNAVNVTPVTSTAHPYLLYNSSEKAGILAKIQSGVPQEAWGNIVAGVQDGRSSPWSVGGGAKINWNRRRYGLMSWALVAELHSNSSIAETAAQECYDSMSLMVEGSSVADEWEKGDRDHGMGRLMFQYAMAYDIMYDWLDANAGVGGNAGKPTLADLRNKLALECAKMYEAATTRNTHGWGSWWPRSYGQNHFHGSALMGMYVAAVALKNDGHLITQTYNGPAYSPGLLDQTEVDKWIDHGKELLKRNHYNNWGISDGSWYEGSFYEYLGIGPQRTYPYWIHRRIYGECYFTNNLHFYMHPMWRLYTMKPTSPLHHSAVSNGDNVGAWNSTNNLMCGLRVHAHIFGSNPATQKVAETAQWVVDRTIAQNKANGEEDTNFKTNGRYFATGGGAMQSTTTHWQVVMEMFAYDSSVASVDPAVNGFPKMFLADDIGIARIGPDFTASTGYLGYMRCGPYYGKHFAQRFLDTHEWDPTSGSGQGGWDNKFFDNTNESTPGQLTLTDAVNGLPSTYPQDFDSSAGHAQPNQGMIGTFGLSEDRHLVHEIPGKKHRVFTHTATSPLPEGTEEDTDLVTRQTRSKNTIVIDGRGQIYGEPARTLGKQVGQDYIEDHQGDHREDFTRANLPDFLHVAMYMDSTLYCNGEFKDAYTVASEGNVEDPNNNNIMRDMNITEARRHYFFFVEDGTQAVCDTLSSTDSHTYSFHITSTEQPTREADNIWIRNEMNGPVMGWGFLNPSNTNAASFERNKWGDTQATPFKKLQGVTQDGNDEYTMWEWKVDNVGTDARFLAYGFPTTSAAWGARPGLQLLTDNASDSSFRVDHDGGAKDFFIFNHHTSAVSITADGEDIDVTGEAAAIRKDSGGDYTKVVLANGTRVDQDGQILISTSSTCNSFEVKYSGATAEVTGKDLSSFTIFDQGTITSVTVNGQSVNIASRNTSANTITVV